MMGEHVDDGLCPPRDGSRVGAAITKIAEQVAREVPGSAW